MRPAPPSPQASGSSSRRRAFPPPSQVPRAHLTDRQSLPGGGGGAMATQQRHYTALPGNRRRLEESVLQRSLALPVTRRISASPGMGDFSATRGACVPLRVCACSLPLAHPRPLAVPPLPCFQCAGLGWGWGRSFRRCRLLPGRRGAGGGTPGGRARARASPLCSFSGIPPLRGRPASPRRGRPIGREAGTRSAGANRPSESKGGTCLASIAHPLAMLASLRSPRPLPLPGGERGLGREFPPNDNQGHQIRLCN